MQALPPVVRRLRAATRQILDALESCTGYQVEYLPDDWLPDYVRIESAHGQSPHHVLRYNPAREPLDYWVAHQAGYLLRAHAVPPAERFELAPTDAGWTKACEGLTAGQVVGDGGQEWLSDFTYTVYEWTLRCLREIPIGMRIDGWLYGEQPELRDLIVEGVELRQAAMTRAVPTFRGLAVPEQLSAMIAASSVHANRISGEPFHEVSECVGKAAGISRELVAAWDTVPELPSHDRCLIETWQAIIGASRWYEWCGGVA